MKTLEELQKEYATAQLTQRRKNARSAIAMIVAISRTQAKHRRRAIQ